jgi:hypothetical protein
MAHQQWPARGRTPRSRGAQLRAAGFDLTTYDRSTGTYAVRCSQCQAAVLNGIAAHERGCPNHRR